MNFYETVYVVHPALQAGRLDDIMQNIDDKVISLKGKKLYFEIWGKKKLAYAIDKQKYGTYVLVQFSAHPEQIKELTSEFEHNANILRYLISKIEEEDVLKEEIKDVNLNTQDNAKKTDQKEQAKLDVDKDTHGKEVPADDSMPEKEQTDKEDKEDKENKENNKE